MSKRKMREIKIFRNFGNINKHSNTMLHQDDMKSYATWLLIEEHQVEKVIYRGDKDDLDPTLLVNNNISIDDYLDCLMDIGTPKNILITQSNYDTY